jgi:hypothetical protein
MRRLFATLLIAASVAATAAAQPAPSSRQERTSTSTTTDGTGTIANSSTVVITDTDSHETREALHATLSRFPPEVSRVLKLDPALLSNQTYLANYPALASFLAQHPEVAHSPAFYLDYVSVPGDYVPDSNRVRVWRSIMEALSVFGVLILMTGVLVWLVRTIIEHRRWNRVSKIQADVHNKLMDRFTSNEELLAYIQTPAGKRFLESAPIPLDPGPRAVSAPVGRILWSVQVGLVLAAGGFGLQYVSGSIDKDVSQPLFAVGVLGVAIGAGFVLSAVVSYLLSRRLGLFESAPLPAEPPPGRD